jgi:hypothetical protein
MKALVTVFCTLLAAGAAFADPYTSAIRQARTAASSGSGQETPPPATPLPQNHAPTNPALQATLQNIVDLRNDLTAISSATGTNRLVALKSSLSNHLAAAAQGAKASQESISKLADDLSTAIAGNEKLRAQLTKLAQYAHASFNGSQLTDAQRKMIFEGVQKTLTDAGVPPDGAAGVVDDFKAIVGETK